MWTPPILADFRTRFPELSRVSDDTMEMILEEAVGGVSDRWLERDRTPGVLYLAAHLAVQGLGVSGGGGASWATAAPIKRRKVGDVETEFAVAESGTDKGMLSEYRATRYGRQYLSLMRRNVPAIAVV